MNKQLTLFLILALVWFAAIPGGAACGVRLGPKALPKVQAAERAGARAGAKAEAVVETSPTVELSTPRRSPISLVKPILGREAVGVSTLPTLPALQTTYVKRQGYCERGGQRVSTNGATSQTTVQQSIPSCTVTVYLTGTVSLAPIFSDAAGSVVLANPLTADSTGYYSYYIAAGTRIDERFSGGTSPNNIATPYTKTDILVAGTSQSQNQTYIYAYDYGVRCDNSTNNTANLAGAIAAAQAASRPLILPSGLCKLTQLVLSDTVQIYGAGKNKTYLVGTADQPIVTVAATAFDVVLHDLSITGNVNYVNQIGLNLAGSGAYWMVDVRNVQIEGVGGAGIKWSKSFSSTFQNILSTNTGGFPYDYDSAGGLNQCINCYFGNLRTTAPIGFRIRQGNFYCVGCNGTNGCPGSGTCTWARVGRKTGVDGDVSSNSAFASWKESNVESWKTYGIEHLQGSWSDFDHVTFAGDPGVTGKIGLYYEVDPVGYPQRAQRGKIDGTTLIGDNLSQYSQSQFIHANGQPPLILDGQGINAGGSGSGVKLTTYYETGAARAEQLLRSDGFVSRIRVTGNINLTQPGIRYIEADCAAGCQIGLPWPGWYQYAQEYITIKDVRGNAGTNPIVVVSTGGATINTTTNYDIRRNYGAITVLPFENDLVSGQDWRIINDYANGTPATVANNVDTNLGFFPTWSTTRGILSASSGLYQSGSDIVVNGGNAVFAKGGQTFTISTPASPANSPNFRFPDLTGGGTHLLVVSNGTGTPADGCAQWSSAKLISTGSACGSGGGGGTVTSFSAGNLAPLFTTAVTNATTTPALAFTLSSQSANLVFSGPSTGAAAAPTFRSLVSDDIPSLSTAKLTSGTLGVTRGGTGLATVAANQVYVGTAADTLTAKTIPSCSNGTTDKLLFNNATQTFTCGVDQTASGGTGITSLNGLTADPQTFAKVDDTNVTLGISSVTATHTFTVGWTGTLAVSRGGTGAATLTGVVIGNGAAAFTATATSAGLAAAISDETGTGALVFASSPTIVTPTIASLVNANHDHSNAAGGGQLTTTAIAAANLQGNGTKFQLFGAGSPATNDCAKFDANGNIVSAGAACGTASGAITATFVSANYTTLSGDRLTLMDATAGNRTVTYLAAASATNAFNTTCKIDTTANTVTVTIGGNVYTLTTPGQCASGASNGTSWYPYNP